MEGTKKADIRVPIDRWDAEILSVILNKESEGIPLKDLISLINTLSNIAEDDVLKKVSRLSNIGLLRFIHKGQGIGYRVYTTFFLLTVDKQIKGLLDELRS